MKSGRSPSIPVLALALVVLGIVGGICAPVAADDGCRCSMRDTPAKAGASGLGGDVSPSEVIAAFETNLRSTVVALAGPVAEIPVAIPSRTSAGRLRPRAAPDSAPLFLLHCSWLN